MTKQTAPVAAKTVSVEEFEKLQAQLAAKETEIAALKVAAAANKLGKAPSHYWQGIGITDVIRALYMLHPDKAAVAWVVYTGMNLPVLPLMVSDCCSQAQRHLDHAKATEEQRKAKKPAYWKWAKAGCVFTDAQKAEIEAMFAKVPGSANPA